MQLICNKLYRVGVILKRGGSLRSTPHKSGSYEWRQNRVVLEVLLNYCGGSVVDDQGNHLGGGVWAHEKLHYQLEDLNILYIKDAYAPTEQRLGKYGRWTEGEVRDAIRIAGKHWRQVCTSCEEATAEGPHGQNY